MAGKPEEPFLSEVDQRKAEYLKHNGVQCLYCQSTELEAGPPDTQDETVRCQVTCQSCGRKWTDVHGIVDIIEHEEVARAYLSAE